MANPCNKYSITLEFFGVETNNTAVFTDSNLMQNKVIDKCSAISLAHKIFSDELTEDECIYISSVPIKANDVRNMINKNILKQHNIPVSQNTSGWIVLFDRDQYANWGHDCQYLYIIDEDDYHVWSDTLPLHHSIKLQII